MEIIVSGTLQLLSTAARIGSRSSLAGSVTMPSMQIDGSETRISGAACATVSGSIIANAINRREKVCFIAQPFAMLSAFAPERIDGKHVGLL